MSVLDRLAGALGRNDEVPNVELAEDLAASGDNGAIAELAAAIAGTDKAVANDAIKVLYELGERKPELIAPHAEAFFAALTSRNNRMVWGALSALDAIAAAVPDVIAARLPEILAAADRSSVIAKDKTVSMLAALARGGGKAADVAWDRLTAILRTSAVNQTPMYAEAALTAAQQHDPAELAAIVDMRLAGIAQPAKRKRLDKVLKKLARLGQD